MKDVLVVLITMLVPIVYLSGLVTLLLSNKFSWTYVIVGFLIIAGLRVRVK